MKLNYRLLAGAAMLIALAGACSKKYNNPNSVEPNTVNPFGGPPSGNNTTPGAQLDKLFDGLKSTPEVKTVTAGIAQNIAFSKGTILMFHPNSFKDKNGNIITSGTITISMIEMYKPGDMIANRATTVSDEGMLQSGGQVYLTFKKDGEEVFANTYGISFPQETADTAAPMELYTSNTNTKDSSLRWKRTPGTMVAGTVTDPTLQPTAPAPPVPVQPRYVFMTSTTTTWINSDWLYGYSGATTPFKVDVPYDGQRGRNTCVYVALRAKNTAVDLNYSGTTLFDDKTKQLTWSFRDGIPVGMDATLVVMMAKDDKYYYYRKDVTVTDGIEVTAEVEEKSIEDIKADLKGI